MKAQKKFPATIVLAKPHYALLFILIAAAFFLLNIYIPNFKFLFNSLGNYSFTAYLTLLLGLFQGGVAILPLHSIILLTIISILTGFVLTLVVFKVKTIKAQAIKGTKAATVGALFGLAAPACAACGIGLLSLIGLGGALAYLPFQGTEIAVVSVGLLSFAGYHLNKNLEECTACQIDLKKAKKKT